MNGDGVINFDDINPFVELLMQGGGPGCSTPGLWLGPGSNCGQCCWITPPYWGIPEDEPACIWPYVDHFNGGCDTYPPVFKPLACGETLFGHGGARGANFGRDTDWFTFTVAEAGGISVTLTPEFTADLWIMRAGSGPNLCDPNDPQGYEVLAHGLAGRCAPFELRTDPVAPGEYWVVVAATGDVGCVCIADYILTLSCQGY